VRPRAAA
jgi:CRP/FNR family transcriptional regulator, cyclic AMP receptor protein